MPKSDNRPSTQLYRSRLFEESCRSKVRPSTACNRCEEFGLECFLMGGIDSQKCGQCGKNGKPCIGVSWESIDRARARLESDLSDSEEKLIKLIAELSLVATRTVRLIREYRRVEVKASEKVACLTAEIEIENKNEEWLVQELDPIVEELPQSILNGIWDGMMDASVLQLEDSFGGNLL